MVNTCLLFNIKGTTSQWKHGEYMLQFYHGVCFILDQQT
jgi:hypothetical protein